MQHKKIIVAGTLLSSLLLVSAQEVSTTNALQGDVDPNGSSTCLTIDTNLRYKMKDSSSDGDIASLQDFLIANRYMQGTPTGYFGLGTFNAVKMFQKKNGLSPTGYVGMLTRAKIKEVSCLVDVQSQSVQGLDMTRSQGERRGSADQKISDGIEKNKKDFASSSVLMMRVNSLMSDADKVILKQREEDIKSKRDAVKALLDSYGGSTKNLTEEQKTALKAKMDEIASSEKSLIEFRKEIAEKTSRLLSDSEKAMFLKMREVDQVRQKVISPIQEGGKKESNVQAPPVVQQGDTSATQMPRQ